MTAPSSIMMAIDTWDFRPLDVNMFMDTLPSTPGFYPLPWPLLHPPGSFSRQSARQK